MKTSGPSMPFGRDSMSSSIFAIGHFRNLKVEETFAETEGRSFGAKLGKLKNLIAKSAHPDRTALLFLISQLFESNRNEITHSYLDTELDEVKFVYMGNSKSGLEARTSQCWADQDMRLTACPEF
jgi:hypothetical protein